MIALELLASFAKIGTLAWGGGPAMVPLMQAEFVEHRGWMTDEQFVDALAAGYALPGPIATKMAVLVGWEQGGALGVTAAMLGMILPSAVMIAAVMAAWTAFRDHPRLEGAMRWVRPVIVGLLAAMVVQIAPKAVTGWPMAAVAAAAAGLVLLDVHPAWLIVAAAGIGAVLHAG